MNVRPRRLFSAVLLVPLAGLLTGCFSDDPTTGYTAKGVYRRGIRTVAIPMVQRGKDVYRRGLEFRLTEALVKRTETSTLYKVVKKPQADTLLTCTIDAVEQATLSMNPDYGTPNEMQLTLVVSYSWEDLRSGKTLARKNGMRVAKVYIPGSPLNEDFFQGSEDVMDEVARRIVENMEAPW